MTKALNSRELYVARRCRSYSAFDEWLTRTRLDQALRPIHGHRESEKPPLPAVEFVHYLRAPA